MGAALTKARSPKVAIKTKATLGDLVNPAPKLRNSLPHEIHTAQSISVLKQGGPRTSLA